MSNGTVDAVPAETRRPSALRQNLKEFWFYFSESKTAVIGLAFLVGIILMALTADFIAPHNPAEQYRHD